MITFVRIVSFNIWGLNAYWLYPCTENKASCFQNKFCNSGKLMKNNKEITAFYSLWWLIFFIIDCYQIWNWYHSFWEGATSEFFFFYCLTPFYIKIDHFLYYPFYGQLYIPFYLMKNCLMNIKCNDWFFFHKFPSNYLNHLFLLAKAISCSTYCSFALGNLVKLLMELLKIFLLWAVRFKTCLNKYTRHIMN